MTGQPHRYFFVHMRKTAGSTLRRRLLNHFGEVATYPTGIDGTNPVTLYFSIDHLQERLAARGDQIRLITGHFPLRTLEKIDGQFTTLTLLREPVERMLSFLRGHRDRYRKSLVEIYNESDGLVDNYMTKMLSWTPAEMAALLSAPVEPNLDHLERAKAALAGVDAVGLQERFEDFCDELVARFGWDLGEPVVLNVSPPWQVPESLRARIAERNALDNELYEFAKQLLGTNEDRARRQTTAAGR
jgi:hypothetical protein